MIVRRRATPTTPDSEPVSDTCILHQINHARARPPRGKLGVHHFTSVIAEVPPRMADAALVRVIYAQVAPGTPAVMTNTTPFPPTGPGDGMFTGDARVPVHRIARLREHAGSVSRGAGRVWCHEPAQTMRPASRSWPGGSMHLASFIARARLGLRLPAHQRLLGRRNPARHELAVIELSRVRSSKSSVCVADRRSKSHGYELRQTTPAASRDTSADVGCSAAVSRWRRRWRARWMRDMTVPTGTPRMSAISL